MEDDYGSRRTMPCCSCICQNLHRRKLENSVISKRVIEQEQVEELEEDAPRNKRDRKGDDNETISFRSKHPKVDIVIKKKKKLPESKQTDDDSKSTQRKRTSLQKVHDGDSQADDDSKNTQRKRKSLQKVHDGDMVFPIALPMEETGSGCGMDIEDGSFSKSEGTSYSVQFCNICLEEYKIGEEIAWSRNEMCHHAFHKSCIIEWLIKHQDCPVCRNKY